ncbi:Hypothetical protein FKW44_022428 [Caligus rogercresseyi]|uniref:Uncharacterized protein n=1 Tax=Caligus rogercresseyi TaxID=217165 RepID=A0A7T8JUM2_CALRO|nr:Hypothetical protein FKW44_022428 [Caligus rogercresseyi]
MAQGSLNIPWIPISLSLTRIYLRRALFTPGGVIKVLIFLLKAIRIWSNHCIDPRDGS